MLIPLGVTTASAATSVTSTAQTLPYQTDVRVLRYDGDFIASSATEGSNGALYVTYYWDKGSTPYESDRFGVLDGSAMRELFAGVFLDEVSVVGENGGYPVLDVGMGSTVHDSDNFGIWSVSDGGVRKIGPESATNSTASRLCIWCVPQDRRSERYCASFAGGRLCDSGPGVTFAKNGTKVEIDKDAYLVGAGPHRFLMVERPPMQSPKYVEGFAASD